ncbi:MAG: hypothetical protein HFJ54_02470 [Clostridia bacterium]|nr:hypothetical protein [Clostridia bacterium]
MKKLIYSIIIAFIVILVVVLINISDKNIKKNDLISFNSQFEEYANRTIYGTDVLTIINKAIDNNEEFDIKKDENNIYIADDEKSVKIDITLLSKNEKEEIIELTYPMERLEKADLNKFVSSFGLTTFKCEKIEYNSKNKVSKISIKQLEL